MLTALIREAECIGCSRCIPACPVDAIIGTHKYLHTVLTSECIGCGLCVEPCPVDCIDMVERAEPVDKPSMAAQAKKRHRARQQRLQAEAQLQLPTYSSVAEKQNQIKLELQALQERLQAKNNATKND